MKPVKQVQQVKDQLNIYKNMISDKRVFFNDEKDIEEFFETNFDETTTTRKAYEAGFLDALEIVVDNIETALEREWD